MTFSFVHNVPALTPLKVEEGNGQRFYYSPNGVKLVSVTTMLGYFKAKSLKNWQDRVGHEEADIIRNRAANRGTKFHNLVERYLKNEDNLFESVMPDMRMAFKDFKPTVDRIDNIRYIEAQLYSEKLGLAGRTDVIGDFDEEPAIVDFKTSTKPKRAEYIHDYFEQKTAYSLMLEELTGIKISKIVTLISVDHQAEPQVFVNKREDFINSLMEKIETYKKVFNVVS